MCEPPDSRNEQQEMPVRTRSTRWMAWSLWVLRRTGSIRMSAVALFTCFLAGFVVLTAMGSIFRGPNWHFYWWPSQWPTH